MQSVAVDEQDKKACKALGKSTDGLFYIRKRRLWSSWSIYASSG